MYSRCRFSSEFRIRIILNNYKLENCKKIINNNKKIKKKNQPTASKESTTGTVKGHSNVFSVQLKQIRSKKWENRCFFHFCLDSNRGKSSGSNRLRIHNAVVMHSEFLFYFSNPAPVLRISLLWFGTAWCGWLGAGRGLGWAGPFNRGRTAGGSSRLGGCWVVLRRGSWLLLLLGEIVRGGLTRALAIKTFFIY